MLKLDDVVEQLEMLMDESTAYLNNQTGELYMVMGEELFGMEEDEAGGSRQEQEAGGRSSGGGRRRRGRGFSSRS